MQRLFSARCFLSFLAKAKTVYNAHSPFLYELSRQVLEDDRHYYAFDELEALRQKMLDSKAVIRVNDLGAGSRTPATEMRPVSAIARNSLITPLKAKWLFRLTVFQKPHRILELGTSLGLSALYLKSAARNAQLISLEGNPSSLRIARQNFSFFPFGKDIQTIEGNFDKTLPEALRQMPEIDLAFLDGNHRKAPTLDYFDRIYPHMNPQGVIVLDDIYWSKEMAEAWQILASDKRVRLSIDLFHFGLLFFRKENLVKEHHVLAPSRWKPWVRAW